MYLIMIFTYIKLIKQVNPNYTSTYVFDNDFSFIFTQNLKLIQVNPNYTSTFVFDNDFPAMQVNSVEPTLDQQDPLFKVKPASGKFFKIEKKSDKCTVHSVSKIL